MELVTRKRVALAKIGDWPAVTGPANLTPEKLQSMVEASKAEWWDGSPIGIGHFDRRFEALRRKRRDGEPSLGGVTNLEFDGEIIWGDFENVPKRFDELMPYAYPTRSIKWEEDVAAPDGTVYPAVLRGLDVLGVEQPGVAGLPPIESLEDVYDLYAASTEPAESLQTAFVGDNGEAIVGALSALSDIIHAQPEKSVHDIGTVQVEVSHDNQGDRNMADTIDLDARLREMLSVSADADLLEEIKKLKTVRSETPDPGEPTPSVEDPKPEEPAKPEDEPRVGEVKPPSDIPEDLIPYINDLAVKANAGAEAARQLREQRVERELKAASKDGRLTPAEFSEWKEFMLAADSNLERGVQMLAKRPAVMATAAVGTAVDDAAGKTDDDGYAAWDNMIFGGRS